MAGTCDGERRSVCAGDGGGGGGKGKTQEMLRGKGQWEWGENRVASP